jgi:hypothetical protein
MAPRKLKHKLKQNQFYCVKCRKAKTAKADDICLTVYDNERIGPVPALKAVCSCNTNLTKFIKRSAVQGMKKKYGSC